jgi:hypothetical protein
MDDDTEVTLAFGVCIEPLISPGGYLTLDKNWE